MRGTLLVLTATAGAVVGAALTHSVNRVEPRVPTLSAESANETASNDAAPPERPAANALAGSTTAARAELCRVAATANARELTAMIRSAAAQKPSAARTDPAGTERTRGFGRSSRRARDRGGTRARARRRRTCAAPGCRGRGVRRGIERLRRSHHGTRRDRAAAERFFDTYLTNDAMREQAKRSLERMPPGVMFQRGMAPGGIQAIGATGIR